MQDHPVLTGTVAVAACAAVLGVVVVSSAHDTRPMQTSEGAEVFAAQGFDGAVDFYRSVCPAAIALRDAPTSFSEAVEAGIGRPRDEAVDGLVTAARSLADAAAAGEAGLPAEAPLVPAADQVAPVDYAPALAAVRGVLSDGARSLTDGADGVAADGSDDRWDSAVSELGDVVSSAGDAAAGALADLSRTAPLPNRKAVDAVTASDECHGLYRDSEVGEDVVHRPQVELYAALRGAHGRWLSVVERYGADSAADAGVDASAMVPELRDAAQDAAADLQRWLDDHPQDPVSGDTGAAQDALGVYLGIVQDADADRPAESAPDAQRWVDDEARLQLRAKRTAPPTNAATSDAIAATEGADK